MRHKVLGMEDEAEMLRRKIDRRAQRKPGDPMPRLPRAPDDTDPYH